ncbi:MAG TPA: sn-glycerol-3-phosphate ABC transporter ATP-binding protein UgpC [Gaiellaceae bacterium]|jgi:multiple sugar transport system ATP-binding protein
MAEIVLDRVTKEYPGGVVAVDEVSLEIGDGEFMVLVGPSGCGKSTLLRMIAGLEEITEGDVSIGGRVVTTVPPKSRDIAMVFQNYALYPQMTVAQNLAFGLRLRKLPKSDVDARVATVARTLGLSELLERKPAALSGGQRQRVAMGRAIVREPKAFLMDEPLSNLDAKLRVQMRGELARLHARLATTTVYVTHDQVEAMTLGERVAVMRAGVLQQVDTPQELFRRPRNLFVAAFMGSPSMNLVHADVGDGAVAFGGHLVPLAEEHRGSVSGQVILGIRPSDFEDAAFARDSELPEIEITVDVVEELGTEAHLIFGVAAPPVVSDAVAEAVESDEVETPLLVADEGDAARSSFTAQVDAATGARPGTTMRLTVDNRAFHFFDADTGERLVR